ncbi:putative methionine synthase, vitamin-b12 independent [Violaceomyces palustris]|uniref:Methionine synthase, vitamin-b12 independent n=1 Tax=Violaceomyces palustris TaxID=1673888 RepID=A0ACD0P7M8_9BASI|nr:putative methionine synthase, vitamin-b12 independent [Violaceomyces palustris]
MASPLPTASQPQRLASSPPFRHDHVGSFLRPKTIHQARLLHSKGEMTDEQLRKVEDAEIKSLVERLISEGVKTLTDGEFRREYFHLDFLKHLQGVTVSKNTLEQESSSPPTLSITSKLGHPVDIEVRNFEYLKSLVPPERHRHIKVTIPSPTMCHFRGGRAAISQQAYPDLEDFFRDLAECYRQEIDALYKAGCRYLQLDDTNLAYLTDPEMRRQAEQRGEDLEELPKRYISLINSSLSSRPADMVVAVHLCKGNFRSRHFAKGSEQGYAPIAQLLLQGLQVDSFFLEWDDESRSGKDFSTLDYLPPTKSVVLGLVSSKLADLEDERGLEEKVRSAASFVPKGIQQLAISPQCGFSSTVHGNEITEEDQFEKLRLCARVAKAVWGEN